MNKVSKIGIVMYIFAIILIIIDMFLLHQKVPNFLLYLFNGGLALFFIGIFIQSRKNHFSSDKS